LPANTSDYKDTKSGIFLHHNKKIKRCIICFAGCDWWYHNQGLFCPQVMRRLSKDYNILFINSLGMRIPSLKEDKHAFKKIFRKLRSISRCLRKVDNRMHVFSPISAPFSSRPGRRLNAYCVLVQVKIVSFLLGFKQPVIYIGCPPALEVVRLMGKRRSMIYERTDLYEEMPGAAKSCIASLDRQLTDSADLVLYVDAAIYKDAVKENPKSLLIGHGVDFPFFADADKSQFIPEDIAQIPKPIIGYFGDICDKTFDFDLMEQLAAGLPNMSFVLIGPLSSNVDCLKKYKNVYILGQKPYGEIPHYGKVFDVSILPWTKNRWVIHSYPVKIKEYLAMGNPFVSVDIPAVEDFKDVIYIAKDNQDFISKVCQAAEDKDIRNRQRRKESVKNETWDDKVRQITDFLGKDADL
jgi:hypothetical protein